MTGPSENRRNVTLAILIFSSSVSVLSTDLYAPSLASLPEYFGTSPAMVKLTMSLNLLAYALCQLVYGPISDRVGRRPVLIGGIAGFMLAGLACAMAQSIEQLILARTFQGIAGAGQGVLVYAVIRDLYTGADRVRAMAIFGIIFGASPAVAPLLGGYIHVAFGWRANFILLTLLAGIALLLVLRFLPESSTPDRHATRLAVVGRSYAGLMRDPVFMSYAVMTGASVGTVFAFLTAGPFIFINNFGVPTEAFGVYYFFIVCSYILGSFVINRLSHSVPPGTSLWVGTVLILAGAALAMWLVRSGAESPLTLTLAMCLIFFGAAPVFAIAPSRAMDATENRVGSASALVGSTELFVGGVAAGAITILHDGTSWPLASTLMALALLGVFLLWRVGHRDASLQQLG